MDNKTFVARLAKLNGSDPKNIGVMINALGAILRDKAADLDSVAIPGFGNFVAMKKQEHIVFDSKTGKRMLVPPKIFVEFIPGSKLKKSVTHE